MVFKGIFEAPVIIMSQAQTNNLDKLTLIFYCALYQDPIGKSPQADLAGVPVTFHSWMSRTIRHDQGWNSSWPFSVHAFKERRIMVASPYSDDFIEHNEPQSPEVPEAVEFTPPAAETSSASVQCTSTAVCASAVAALSTSTPTQRSSAQTQFTLHINTHNFYFTYLFRPTSCQSHTNLQQEAIWSKLCLC